MNFNKIICLGKNRNGYIFANIEFENGDLSITGVEAPRENGDAHSAGQIILHKWNFTEYQPGWSLELVEEFRAVWDRWHLNGMRAGTPNQTAAIEEGKRTGELKSNDYNAVCAYLRTKDLLWDKDYKHKDKPGEYYKYGTAWLTEEVPQQVIDFLQSLPDSEEKPAWI